MKKVFKIISLFSLVVSFNAQNIFANSDDQNVKATFDIIKETDLVKEKNGSINESQDFKLKMTIPDGWKIYSYEKQAIGKEMFVTTENKNVSVVIKSLDVKLKAHDAMDKKKPTLEITYPKSEEDHPVPNDKNKINHIYKGEIIIGIKTLHYDQKDKELLVDYTMCSKDLCVNHKDKVHFGHVEPKPTLKDKY